MLFCLLLRQSLFYFQRCWKILSSHWLRQLTRDAKNDVRILNFRNDVTDALPRKTTNDVRRRSLCDKNVIDKRNDERYLIIFTVIRKNNNQTSICDAGREIPILGSSDNAGNLVNRVSGIIRTPSG